MGNEENNSKFHKMECRYCGAPLERLDRTRAKCSFCGQIHIMEEIPEKKETKRPLPLGLKIVIGYSFLMVVGFIVILVINIGGMSSYDSASGFGMEVSSGGSGTLFELFCEDLFDKNYKDISDEEMASVKYLRYGYERGADNEHYHIVEYSFTDYQDCESEEEFQNTIQMWAYPSERIAWPADYSMFKGLTRISTDNTVWLSALNFWDENEISYVETDDSLSTVAEVLNPDKIKVLHIGIMGDDMETIEEFPNLEELIMESNMSATDDAVDISMISECKNLRTLKLDFAGAYTGLESLAQLTELESLYISNTPLEACSFLKELPRLEELSLYCGEEPDLSVLSHLPNLKKLHFQDYEEIDAKELIPLTELEELTAHFASTDSLNDLAKLKKLKKLTMSVELEYFSYTESNPVDLSVLSELTELTELKVEFGGEGRFCGLESILNMPELKLLHIGSDAISRCNEFLMDEEILGENENIEVLSFENCIFTDGAAEENLSTEFLGSFKKVKELYLIRCGLTDIDFVSGLQDLEICALRDNEIRDYAKLLECGQLKALYVNNSEDVNVTFSQDVYVSEEYFYYGVSTD